jgi:hypothetical protein
VFGNCDSCKPRRPHFACAVCPQAGMNTFGVECINESGTFFFIFSQKKRGAPFLFLVLQNLSSQPIMKFKFQGNVIVIKIQQICMAEANQTCVRALGAHEYSIMRAKHTIFHQSCGE